METGIIAAGKGDPIAETGTQEIEIGDLTVETGITAGIEDPTAETAGTPDPETGDKTVE